MTSRQYRFRKVFIWPQSAVFDSYWTQSPIRTRLLRLVYCKHRVDDLTEALVNRADRQPAFSLIRRKR